MATALGIKQSTYSHMEIGERSNLSIDHMHTLLKKFGVNHLFLLEGKHPMYSRDVTHSDQAVIQAGCYLVPVAAQAGYADGSSDRENDRLPRVVIPGFEGANAMVFKVEGESMFPIIQDGDYVACTRIERPSQVRDGLIYVVVSRTSGLMIKYLQARRNSIRCISHDVINFKTYELDFEDIREIWEVQLRITKKINNHGFDTQSIGSNSRVDRLESLVDQLAKKNAL